MPSVDTLSHSPHRQFSAPIAVPGRSLLTPENAHFIQNALAGYSHSLDDQSAADAADNAITASEALASQTPSAIPSEPSSPLRSHRNSYLFGPNKSFLTSLLEQPLIEEEAVVSESCMEVDKPAGLGSLPPEVLSIILKNVMIQSTDEPSASLARLLRTSFIFYDVGIPVLYRHVSFLRPHTFDKFRRSIERSGYGILVRSLDFSAFTSVGLGRTGRMMMEIQMVTASTVLAVLDLCPNVNEFLAAESIDMDLDARVINRLIDMPRLNAIDFCGSTSTKGFMNALNHSLLALDAGLPVGSTPQPISNITKLSFHGCSTIPSETFARILPKLTNLTRLDLTHTLVTPEALLSLPTTCQLTHLSLAKCVKLNSHELLKFLLLHPATRTLEWLNLMFDVTKPAPISERDFDTIMRYMPTTLKYLNLNGCPVRESHLPRIAALAELESLSIGYSSISVDALQKYLPMMPNLKYLDVTGNPLLNVWSLQASAVFRVSDSIDIFELSSEILKKLKGVPIDGFAVELGKGRRGWLYRVKPRSEPMSTAINEQPLPERSGFSFSQVAQERIRRRASPPPQQTRIVSDARLELNEDWDLVSRKINMSEIGAAGSNLPRACVPRGLYAYYGFDV